MKEYHKCFNGGESAESYGSTEEEHLTLIGRIMEGVPEELMSNLRPGDERFNSRQVMGRMNAGFCQLMIADYYKFRNSASWLLNHCQIEIGHGGSIYATDIVQHIKSGLFFPNTFPAHHTGWTSKGDN